MPRKPRYQLPEVGCHVIQRGNNRSSCLFEPEDYAFHLECLMDVAAKYRCAVHAYVLMTNHVDLPVTPEASEGVSRLMQSVGRRSVQYVNVSYKRSSALRVDSQN